MEKKKFTLDRIEESFYVFLEYPEENQQLLIPVNKYDGTLSEGDIVFIKDNEIIEVLELETQITRKQVNDLLEKLKNKK